MAADRDWRPVAGTAEAIDFVVDKKYVDKFLDVGLALHAEGMDARTLVVTLAAACSIIIDVEMVVSRKERLRIFCGLVKSTKAFDWKYPKVH